MNAPAPHVLVRPYDGLPITTRSGGRLWFTHAATAQEVRDALTADAALTLPEKCRLQEVLVPRAEAEAHLVKGVAWMGSFTLAEYADVLTLAPISEVVAGMFPGYETLACGSAEVGDFLEVGLRGGAGTFRVTVGYVRTGRGGLAGRFLPEVSVSGPRICWARCVYPGSGKWRRVLLDKATDYIGRGGKCASDMEFVREALRAGLGGGAP